MLRIDNSLLQEVGLSSLPDSEKNSLLKHIYETLEMRVGIRLADQMSNEQLDEFERYFEAKDDAGAFKWLETNFPNYKDIVQEEFDKLKLEISQSAPQILSTSQTQNSPISSPQPDAVSASTNQPPSSPAVANPAPNNFGSPNNVQNIPQQVTSVPVNVAPQPQAPANPQQFMPPSPVVATPQPAPSYQQSPQPISPPVNNQPVLPQPPSIDPNAFSQPMNVPYPEQQPPAGPHSQ